MACGCGRRRGLGLHGMEAAERRPNGFSASPTKRLPALSVDAMICRVVCVVYREWRVQPPKLATAPSSLQFELELDTLAKELRQQIVSTVTTVEKGVTSMVTRLAQCDTFQDFFSVRSSRHDSARGNDL